MQEEEPEEKRSILHQKLVRITLYITYAGLFKLRLSHLLQVF